MHNRAMMTAALLLLVTGCASHQEAAGPSSGTAAPAASAAAGSGSSTISETQARRMIEQDGYGGVTALHPDGAGGWTGAATANGKPVTVTVSSTGSVGAR